MSFNSTSTSTITPSSISGAASAGNSFNPMDIMKKMDEDFVAVMVFIFIIIVVICMIFYFIYLSRLQSNECSYMNDLYGSMSSYIHSIPSGNPDFSGNLNDYYIKTAYNACSGGSYKNDYVDICHLKALLKQGVRGLDFEVYSVDNQPVVATSTMDDFYIKETFNTVSFNDVMTTLVNYGLASGTCPNYTDPLIIHLRIKSNNQDMYKNLAKLLKSYSSHLLGKEYSYENYGHNFGRVPLSELYGKISIIVDRNNTSFLNCKEFMEYVNMTSNSIFMRGLNFYDVQYSPDIKELQDFNRKNMTIVYPDTGPNPPNPNGIIAREAGCQMVAMRYQYVDTYLEENALFFDRGGCAFQLKPLRLRYQPVIIPDPVPQAPQLSYATRTASADYYTFNS